MTEPEISGIHVYPVDSDLTRLTQYTDEFPITESRNSHTAVYQVDPRTLRVDPIHC